jgi:hypothetical protein
MGILKIIESPRHRPRGPLNADVANDLNQELLFLLKITVDPAVDAAGIRGLGRLSEYRVGMTLNPKQLKRKIYTLHQ